jgi:two-component system chemotaxis response regulator CheB
MIRVLVVDDSATARESIVAILGGEPEIEIVGQATNGLEGVELAAQLRPDVITMDIHMPKMNGYQATQRIMAAHPTPIVVVTGATQQERVHRGLDILLAGALEIVQKPSSLARRDYQSIGGELIAKVKAVSQVNLSGPSTGAGREENHVQENLDRRG